MNSLVSTSLRILLRDDLADHMPMHVGEAAVDAVVADGELRVVRMKSPARPKKS